MPLPVAQRGVNHCVTFLDNDDYRYIPSLLSDSIAKHRVQLHACMSVTNQVRLVATSTASSQLSFALRQLGNAKVAVFSYRH
ncbi:MAG: hypothetical protein ABI268_08250 [Rhodanobacter sp.]